MQPRRFYNPYKHNPPKEEPVLVKVVDPDEAPAHPAYAVTTVAALAVLLVIGILILRKLGKR